MLRRQLQIVQLQCEYSIHGEHGMAVHRKQGLVRHMIAHQNTFNSDSKQLFFTLCKEKTGLKNKLINTCNKLKFATDRNCLFPSESFPAVFECQNKVKFAILSGLPCFNAGKMSNVIDFRWKSCDVVINHRNMDPKS